MAPRSCLTEIATLETQSTRSDAHAGSLRTTQPRAFEKTRGRSEKTELLLREKADVGQK